MPESSRTLSFNAPSFPSMRTSKKAVTAIGKP